MRALGLRRLVVDLERCHGNTVVDVDGRSYVDLNTNIASLPLGYNHPALVMAGHLSHHLQIHRSALNLWTPKEHTEHLQTLWPRLAPFEGAYLWLGSSGSEAVEAALKHCTRYRGEQARHAFVSFEGGFHGRTLGALSLTQSNPHHKRTFPSIESVTVPFPASAADEARCVERLGDVLFERGGEVSGVIVEPVQAEGGDRFASHAFFRSVRSVCARADVPLIVDEVQTGMSLGDWWGHTRWGLEVPPDMVVFSKKYQVAGLWAGAKFAPRPEDEFAFNSTWGGDAWRSQLLSSIVDTVEAEDLFERSVRAGERLFDGLRALPGGSLRNVRNVGGFGAFDVDDRDRSIARLQEEGILVTGCGVSRSIRIRPSLVFDESDVPPTLERIERALVPRLVPFPP